MIRDGMRNRQQPKRLRLTRILGWLTLRLTCAPLLLMLTGCTVVLTPSQPPLVLAPATRPPLVDSDNRYTQAGTLWLQDLVNAYLRNCVTLRVLRGEDPQQCDRGLR